MNRETSIHSSDTLVVVDRSRRQRQIIVAAALAIIVVLVVVGLLMARSSNKPVQGAGAGQVPSVSVIVPQPAAFQ